MNEETHSVISQLKGLLKIVNLCIVEGEQRIAEQRQRIGELKVKGQPTDEEERTLDLMLTVVASMRDNQAMIELQISGAARH